MIARDACGLAFLLITFALLGIAFLREMRGRP